MQYWALSYYTTPRPRKKLTLKQQWNYNSYKKAVLASVTVTSRSTGRLKAVV